jgi:hypothetical protein
VLRSFFGNTLDEENLDLLVFIVSNGARYRERKVFFKDSQRALARKLVELETSDLLDGAPGPRKLAQWAVDFIQYQGKDNEPTEVTLDSVERNMREAREDA